MATTRFEHALASFAKATRDRSAHLLIGECEEPADTAFSSIRQVQPKSLNQHHVGELLRDQRAARLLLSEGASYAT